MNVLACVSFLDPPASPPQDGNICGQETAKVADKTKLGPKIVDWFVANGIDTINKLRRIEAAKAAFESAIS